ncbi:MAG: hypothetical protein N3I86_13960 [Verrucomicrobiae bacterium]|nr:hypothetical protein [Verrucomicrobiae bacterium]
MRALVAPGEKHPSPASQAARGGKGGAGCQKAKPKPVVATVLLGFLIVSAVADDRWPAVSAYWNRPVSSPADVSFLLRPANDRISVRNGRLVRGDGSRFRIWGVNVTGAACIPATNAAPIIAARLAALGVNCVRFHFLDRVGVLIPADRNDTRELDPDALARLDRFVFELKKRGIYSDLNLNVYRTYKPGDGVREHEQLGIGKAATYFDERLLQLQREYARQLLTHVNPHTGKAYAEEPAVAIVELVNENSLVEAWVSGRLDGTQTNRSTGTWHDIPPTYAADLTSKFNTWLAARTASALPETIVSAKAETGGKLERLRQRELARADPKRFALETEFYMQLEREYFRDMARFLREELGVKALLIGNSDHGHGQSFYPSVVSLAQLDVVDGHVYWQHPSYITDPKSGRRTGFRIPNTPMVDDPLRSTVVRLSRTAVAGKPFTVSEANHPFPNEYAAEGIPILAAYAALQDWDGIFWYTLAHQDVTTMEKAALTHFDLARDPVKISQLASGALLFLRGDVRPARRTITRTYSREQIIESLRLPRKEAPYFTPGFPLALPLMHAVRVASFDGPPTARFEPVLESDVIVADTDELKWRKGRVTVDTPRWQAVIGRGSGQTANLRTEPETAFCAVTVASLDDKPIASASRLLLTVGARVANTGMVWNESRTTLVKWGGAPVRLEPVGGRIRLVGLAAAGGTLARALDGAGDPMGESLPLRQAADGWILELGGPPTVWYVIEVRR